MKRTWHTKYFMWYFHLCDFLPLYDKLMKLSEQILRSAENTHFSSLCIDTWLICTEHTEPTYVQNTYFYYAEKWSGAQSGYPAWIETSSIQKGQFLGYTAGGVAHFIFVFPCMFWRHLRHVAELCHVKKNLLCLSWYSLVATQYKTSSWSHQNNLKVLDYRNGPDFSGLVTIQCKNPFLFCLWSSCSQVNLPLSTSFFFNSFGTQFPCFWMKPAALQREEIADCVTPNDFGSSSWVWIGSNIASDYSSSNYYPTWTRYLL